MWMFLACLDRGPSCEECDADGDGHASVEHGGEDCDDDDATVQPFAAEICDNVDNDCDGLRDDLDPDWIRDSGKRAWLDVDGDGYGDVNASLGWRCRVRDGEAEVAGDCDDRSDAVNPDAKEICNGVDDDCDGTVDVDAKGADRYWPDTDGDGAGAGTLVRACTAPADHVANDDDCDPDDPAVAGPLTWRLDGDGDGVGAGAATVDCNGVGVAGELVDCDDGDPDVSPLALELCNGIDDDCDGLVDDDDPTVSVDEGVYADADDDGFGDPDVVLLRCDAPLGWTTDSTDCDDDDGDVFPGRIFYVDDDGDGFGGPTTVTDCFQPVGTALSEDDCDDANPAIGAAGDWLPDGDGDGYGAGTPAGMPGCTPPATGDWGPAASPDCNDSDTSVNPAAFDECDDSIDQDCDGVDARAIVAGILPSWGFSSHPSLAWGTVPALATTGCTTLIEDIPTDFSSADLAGYTVLVGGNPGGGSVVWTASQLQAIRSYVESDTGGIVVTYLLGDNVELADLVGEDPDSVVGVRIAVDPTVEVRRVHPLTRGLPASFSLLDLAFAEQHDGPWLLDGAEIVASDATGRNAVVSYGGNRVRILGFAEFVASADTEQLLWNALYVGSN